MVVAFSEELVKVAEAVEEASGDCFDCGDEEFVGERVSSSWQSILSMSSDILVVDIVRLGSSVTSGMALRRPKPKICLTKSVYDLLNQNRKLRNIMCRQSRKKCLEQSENSPLKKT